MTDTIEQAYRRGYRDDALNAVSQGIHLEAPYSISEQPELFYAWMVGAEDALADRCSAGVRAEPWPPADLRKRISHHILRERDGSSLH